MLVIVHDRNVQLFLQALFYLETFRSLYILQVDTAECRCDGLYGFYEFVRIFLVDFDIENVDACIDFKEQAFPSMTGFPLMAPMSPSPSTAVPFDMTATRFPFAV